MNDPDLFRIALHNPYVMAMALSKLSYRSRIRAVVETELLASARTPSLAFACMHPGLPGHHYPKMTVETFAVIIERIVSSGMYVDSPYEIGNLVRWWAQNMRLFSDTQAPVVLRMLRHAEKLFDIEKYLIPFLEMVPDTPAFNAVRTKVCNLFLKFLEKTVRYEYQDIRVALSYIKSVERVAHWPVDGERFKTILVTDEYRRWILNRCSHARSESARHLTTIGLAFALRTEAEFLAYWAGATDMWRVRLAGMYGKISAGLLARMLSKYHQNAPVVEMLLRHPDISTEQLTFFMVRGNKTAADVLAKRTAAAAKTGGGSDDQTCG